MNIFSFQVTAKEAQSIYLKVVESSYFNVSDKVFSNHAEPKETLNQLLY